MSRVATVRIADLDRVFKAMARNGLQPRVIVRPDGVEVFGDKGGAAVDFPAPVGKGGGALDGADDLDAELQAWRARHDQGEP